MLLYSYTPSVNVFVVLIFRLVCVRMKALVVGGTSGIGLGMVSVCIGHEFDEIHVVGRDDAALRSLPWYADAAISDRIFFHKIDLQDLTLKQLRHLPDVDFLFISAGLGRLALAEEVSPLEIRKVCTVNMVSAMQIISLYVSRMKSRDNFYCGVVCSIAGHVASPFFSAYGAAKSGLRSYVESVNSELAAEGYANRILDFSPGKVEGTRFAGGENDLTAINEIASQVYKHILDRDLRYIPRYEEVFKNVIDQYNLDYLKFGEDSYRYKLDSGRLSEGRRCREIIGYLQGTFDLFHIGHLNLLRRAKEHCDYLIVGVHESGAWKGKDTFIPLEERMAILQACKYVDEVTQAFPEDSDAWDVYHYHRLFVGSDYKGTERFARYEEYFKDKDCEIVYFPYTTSTSSSKLRKAISE